MSTYSTDEPARDPAKWIAERRIIRAFYASDPTASRCVGRAISYTPYPTVVIEMPDGSRESWLASLCEPTSEVVAAPVSQGPPPPEHAIDDAEDYRFLADHIIELTNPADDDVAEVSIVMDAVTRLHQLAESLPCECPALEMGDDYGIADACLRCRALGRFADRRVDW